MLGYLLEESYLPPQGRPPNGMCLYLGWETQFEWHCWNHHQLKSSCQLVSVVWVARMTPALFISGFYWLAGNLCSSFPGSMFDRGFVSVSALESMSGLQEKPDKTIGQTYKHCCMLTHWWVYSSELLRTFYHKISILFLELTSSGHWCVSLTYIGMIGKPKNLNRIGCQHKIIALHGEIPPVVCLDTVNHCYCLHVSPVCTRSCY